MKAQNQHGNKRKVDDLITTPGEASPEQEQASRNKIARIQESDPNLERKLHRLAELDQFFFRKKTISEVLAGTAHSPPIPIKTEVVDAPDRIQIKKEDQQVSHQTPQIKREAADPSPQPPKREADHPSYQPHKRETGDCTRASSHQPLKREPADSSHHPLKAEAGTTPPQTHHLPRSNLSSEQRKAETSAGTKQESGDRPSGGINSASASNSLPDPQAPGQHLTPLQLKCVDLIKMKKNVQMLGPAGTGKSELVKHLVAHILPKAGVFITAPTGVAAAAVRGITLHSFAGVGLAQGSKELLGSKLSRKAKYTWKRCKVLIIDEISMVSADLWDKIEYVARIARGCTKPFGGVQVLVFGDYLQMPPIDKSGMAFESITFHDVISETVQFTHIFRQSDPIFIKALSEMRLGKCSPETTAVFGPCLNRVFTTETQIIPTKLYALRADVDRENQMKLAEIASPAHYYEATDRGELIRLKDMIIPGHLTLKVGAQVLYLKNDTKLGLVNGSRGVVTGFASSRSGGGECSANEPNDREKEEGGLLFPRVRFLSGLELIVRHHDATVESEGLVIAGRHQLPLMLCWAISIHKAQGMTLDRCSASMKGIFEYGQAYTQFSRVRSLEGLQLLDINPLLVKAHPSALRYCERLSQSEV